ncbi:MAG: sigma-70 family RNA polymerase sigma factor [Bacteroidales bacterium]|nr:sigma-70 family RNA polymerase sigma factor [Bacteroidales bacterium]
MKSENDSFYIQKVIHGDVKAYSMLVEKHKDMVFTIALRIVKNREDAEEIAQDVFIKAYQSLPKFKGTSKFSTWLYKIVYNSAISKIRKKKIEKSGINNEIINNYTLDEIHENLDNFEPEEQKLLIDKMLGTLNPEENTLINLYYYQTIATKEIADVLGISQSNVKVKLHRIRNKMQLELNRILTIQQKEMYHG